MKKKILLALGLLTLIVIFLFLRLQQPLRSEPPRLTFTNGKTIILDLARTPSEQSRGLMERTTLKEDEGMLFIYEQEQPLRFWMKNTLIPLDIIFIDEQKTIIDLQTMTSCTQEPCMVYVSKKPARYALEVNAGIIEKNKLVEGEQVIFNLPS